jgi:hypothetical protein
MGIRALVLGAAVASSMVAIDPATAGETAESLLCEKPRDASRLWSARRALARSGDLDLVRTALLHYFDDPVKWGRVLGEAERSTQDVRLSDFRSRARDSLHVPRPPVETNDLILDNVLSAPMDLGTVRAVVAGIASSPGASPGAFAGLYRFHEQWGDAFLPLLSERRAPALVERARFVLALSGDRKRLPLLVELAFGESSPRSREAALDGLAEMELGPFAMRLHRLAGAPERWVRFRVAAVLLPGGDAWAMRLLVANVDPESLAEVHRARRAIDRLGEDRARVLLEEMALDGTATPFAVERLLEMGPKQSRRRSSPPHNSRILLQRGR